MQIGDEFKLQGKGYDKCHFRVRTIDPDGGIVAEDINEVRSNRLVTPVVYIFGAPCMTALDFKWIVLNGENQTGRYVEKVLAAIEFLPIDAPIDLAVGHGMRFENVN